MFNTRMDRQRFLRIGAFGLPFKSADELLLNSDVNETTLILTEIIDLFIQIGHHLMLRIVQI